MADQLEVSVFTFYKKDLMALAEQERALILQLGHVCNELAFFHKLMLVVSDTEHHGVAGAGSTAQIMMVARIFIGKVLEGWLMLGKLYFGSQLRREFDPLLENEANGSLLRLNRDFGWNKLLATVRNRFAFVTV